VIYPLPSSSSSASIISSCLHTASLIFSNKNANVLSLSNAPIFSPNY
jgi:hypothetical protein